VSTGYWPPIDAISARFVSVRTSHEHSSCCR